MKNLGIFLRRKAKLVTAAGLMVSFYLLFMPGCSMTVKPEPGRKTVLIETTGYCPCKVCCNWERNWLFQPVFKSGKLKGKRKIVGQCADGTMAEYGTIAADTRYYPFKTRMFIPGYGYGTVHDRGGDIIGARRLDLYFDSHGEALEWGRKRVAVTIY